MAHGMGKSDKALAVRIPMWHGLEEVLDQAPSRTEAEALVHDYSVIREPLYRKVLNPDFTEHYELVPDTELNVKNDGTVFGAVSSSRIDVNPTEVWDVAEQIMNTKGFGNIVVETAGTYHEGRSMYILLKLDEEIHINGDHKGASIPYFALQNGYTMGQAFRFQPTNVRIQCWNTSQAADFSAEQAGLNLSLAHTQNLLERITEIEEKLQAWRTGIDAWKEAKEELARTKVSVAQTNWFIEQFMWMPEMASDRVRDNVELARVQLLGEYFDNVNDGVRGTALGLFEAASSYQGYVREAQNNMTRFRRSMLSPDTTLRQAADLARDAALV